MAEAMRNYLARLGWAHGDEEIIPTDKLIKWFDLKGINKAPARLDIEKLQHINGHYIRSSDENRLMTEISALIERDDFGQDLTFDKQLIDLETLKQSLPFLSERSKTLVELLNSASYLFQSIPLTFEAKATKTLSKDQVPEILSKLKNELENCTNWEKEEIELVLKQFAADQSLKFGQIAPPLRAVLTGSTVSPGIYDVLYSLGQQESLKRIEAFFKP